MSLLDKVFDAGLVGEGGAGFPTHIKLNCKVEYLLLNAAECEPLLHTDKYILRNFAGQILDALKETADLVEAGKVFIAVKAVNTEEIASIERAIAEKKSDARIFKLDNYYPAGDEQMLVYDITGRIVPPGQIPLKVGALVSNAATMLAIYDALSGKPLTHKFLTVAGRVKRPAVLRAPVGASFAECIAACGGAGIDGFNIIAGGPMMGGVYHGVEAENLPVTKVTSGILALPGEGNFIARNDAATVRQILSRAKSACIQCSFCTDLCPRRLIGHSLRPHRIMRKMAMMDFDKALEADDILREALICCGCGVCETFACPMALSPRQVNKYVKSRLKGERFEQKEALYPSPMRNYRKISPKKIMARMGLLEEYANWEENYIELAPKRVRIPCSQHIGAPAVPVVSAGDTVECGQLIAKAAEGKPSANVHASIPGRVVSADSVIVIEREA
ncbi:MAG: SLBB domain-containing protein [Spirochaetaceae bacterium]|jgi:Na+-translocating ferredoxin:NAD+ oxidoreductase RnfC subunit|nr:SLBB domain-containing protein [Spirochaetaceae bacterium]